MSRITAVVGLTLALAVSTVGVAVAAYPPAAPSVGVSDSTVQPGASITVSGDRWQANSTISLSFHSAVVSLGSAQTDASGSFSTSVTIPSNATAGTHQIVARGVASNGRQRTVGTNVTVLGDVVSGSGSTAFTGSQLDVWMVLAATLLVLGIALLIVGRRRVRTSR